MSIIAKIKDLMNVHRELCNLRSQISWQKITDHLPELTPNQKLIVGENKKLELAIRELMHEVRNLSKLPPTVSFKSCNCRNSKSDLKCPPPPPPPDTGAIVRKL